MATKYLFVCGHDTKTLRKKIENLKELNNDKLAIASATPNFNVNDILDQAQPGVNYYGLKLNVPVYAKAMVQAGPFSEFKTVFHEMLDAGFMDMDTDSILAFKQDPQFRNKLLGINGEDNAKIDLLINGVDKYFEEKKILN